MKQALCNTDFSVRLVCGLSWRGCLRYRFGLYTVFDAGLIWLLAQTFTPRFAHILNLQELTEQVKQNKITIQIFFFICCFFVCVFLQLNSVSAFFHMQISTMGKCSLWSLCELFNVTVIQQVFQFLTQKKQQMIVIVSLLRSLQNAAYCQS